MKNTIDSKIMEYLIRLTKRLKKDELTSDDLDFFENLSQKDLIEFQERKLVTLKKVFNEIKILFRKISAYSYVDNNILNLFDSEIVNKESNKFEGKTYLYYCLESRQKYKDVVRYLKKEGIYLELTLLQGLLEVIDIITSGHIITSEHQDRIKIHLAIPLSTLNKNGVPCILSMSWSYLNRLELNIIPVGSELMFIGTFLIGDKKISKRRI